MGSTTPTVAVGPMLSMFDPIYLGIDEAGEAAYLPLMYHNLLVGGVPGSGKSVTAQPATSAAVLDDITPQTRDGEDDLANWI